MQVLPTMYRNSRERRPELEETVFLSRHLGDPSANRSARRAAKRRGSVPAVDARREPDEMAPAHIAAAVLRDDGASAPPMRPASRGAYDPRYLYLFNSYYEVLGAPPPRGRRGRRSRAERRRHSCLSQTRMRR